MAVLLECSLTMMQSKTEVQYRQQDHMSLAICTQCPVRVSVGGRRWRLADAMWQLLARRGGRSCSAAHMPPCNGGRDNAGNSGGGARTRSCRPGGTILGKVHLTVREGSVVSCAYQCDRSWPAGRHAGSCGRRAGSCGCWGHGRLAAARIKKRGCARRPNTRSMQC